MGSLAATAPGASSSGRTYTCRIAEIRAAGDDEDREAIDSRMDAPRAVHSDRALAAWLGVADGTVTKHRQRRCVCYRSNG